MTNEGENKKDVRQRPRKVKSKGRTNAAAVTRMKNESQSGIQLSTQGKERVQTEKKDIVKAKDRKKKEAGRNDSDAVVNLSGGRAENRTKNDMNTITSSARNGGQIKKKPGNRSRTKHIQYPQYERLSDCVRRYVSGDTTIARGRMRTMPGGALAFVSCDRGKFAKDIVLNGEKARNRALDGDTVFVEIIGLAKEDTNIALDNEVEVAKASLEDFMNTLDINVENECAGNVTECEDIITAEEKNDASDDWETWQDDETQRVLWNPTVSVRKRKVKQELDIAKEQYQAMVIHVVIPNGSAVNQPSEINPTNEGKSDAQPSRIIVGTLMNMPGQSSKYLFVPNSRTLPRFVPRGVPRIAMNPNQLFRAEYVYGSWRENDKWPPCINVKAMGQSCNVEDETAALLLDHGVDHGEFSPEVLKNVDEAVRNGRIISESGEDLGWAPTPEMYKGRRDYRSERIFTIDPTTAKDLDDALHIKPLPDGRVEIGVHIADVSAFVLPETHVDEEAARRTTTVYLVDRVIPMLPRPLCEIACSLNENVERLAFSCVWKMNMDGSMSKKRSKNSPSNDNEVWYGRTVIRSCARLDYATAQNIIDEKVAYGEKVEDVDETLWPKSRQPTGGHTINQVAHDVRLMHKVAMARRKLRFENGALALNGIKLTFQLGDDGQTPMLCEPYPIRDSNRLIEEFMLLANYLVAQRLITHAGGLALLRQHSPPSQDGLQNVIDLAKEKGFDIDGTTSQTLQESLSLMGRVCEDELFLKCITELLMRPMLPAEYIASGEFEQEEWCHFALNIPYYTHFTSPIRRYADVLVHRLLQATLDGKDAVKDYPQSERDIQSICSHCNEKRMASKKAQERSDRVFLSIFLKSNPIQSTLGVVVSIGEKAFTVYVPKIGASGLVYLENHQEEFDTRIIEVSEGKREMIMVPKTKRVVGDGDAQGGVENIPIKIFSRVDIAVLCKESAPIDISLRLVGNWRGE